MDLNLNKNDELSLILKVDYLGKTSELDLNSTLESLSLSKSSSNETFELISKDGKAVLVKK